MLTKSYVKMKGFFSFRPEEEEEKGLILNKWIF